MDGDGASSPGDQLLYTITIANRGNAPATDLQFSDTPDVATTVLPGSVQTSQGTVIGGNDGAAPIVVDLGTLPAGQSAMITFRVTIASTVGPEVINQGTVSATGLSLVTNDPQTTATMDRTRTVISRPPTAITLSGFQVFWEKGLARVAWVTASEVDSWGFRIYRSTTPNRADARLVSDSLIPAAGRDGQGSSYSWLDRSLEAGAQRAYYWLEAVDLDGTSQFHGPAVTPSLQGEGMFKVCLPIVVR